MKNHPILRQWILCLTVLLTGSLMMADEHIEEPENSSENQARWYKVDLIIFANNSQVEKQPEIWPTYPIIKNTLEPIDLIDSRSDQIDSEDLLDPTPAANQNPDADLNDQTDILSEESTSEQSANIVEISATLVELIDPPKAFELLEGDEKGLQREAESIEKDRRTRLLTHQSWYHPILPEDMASPIRITGGEKYGPVRELEGLITIHVSRYLHINTELFMSDVIMSTSNFGLGAGISSDPRFNIESTAAPTETVFEGMNLFGNSNSSSTDSPAREHPVVISSALMEETRRMRSKELHYIDNPKFGLLIYLTPVEWGKESGEFFDDAQESEDIVDNSEPQTAPN